MPVVKTKTVHIAFEVPCYGIRDAMKCADQIIAGVETYTPPVNKTVRAAKYTVKTVRIA